MKYILVGSYGNDNENRKHVRDLARGITEYDVAETFKEAETLINTLKINGEKYFAIFNMNVLDREEVDKSGLVKQCENNAILSYNHRLPMAA